MLPLPRGSMTTTAAATPPTTNRWSMLASQHPGSAVLVDTFLFKLLLFFNYLLFGGYSISNRYFCFVFVDASFVDF
jgi:hypothetical protein